MTIARCVHLPEFVLVPLFLLQAGLTDFWGIAAGIFFLAMLIWQHAILSPKDLSRLNAAFFTANGIASLVFCALIYISVLCA